MRIFLSRVGTNVAIEAADVILVKNRLFDVVISVDLTKVVFGRIQYNLMWALVYNILSIPFAAGVWFPWTRVRLPPQYAGLLMALSSISVVLSSISLNYYRPPIPSCAMKMKGGGASSLSSDGDQDIDEEYGPVDDEFSSLLSSNKGGIEMKVVE